MSILRSDEQIALNELIVACREAANGHRTAADLVSQEALVQQLREVARDREAMAEKLAELVLEEDDIPDAPSAEKELLESAVARLKLVISDDEVLQALEDCKLKERKVVEAAEALLATGPEDALRQDVEALKADASQRLAHVEQDYRSA